MTIGNDLVRALRTVELPTYAPTTTTRMLVVVQLFGGHCPLDTSISADENIERCLPEFKAEISKINEVHSLNVKSAIELFKNLIKARYYLAVGTAEPALLAAVIQSDEYLSRLSPLMKGDVEMYLSDAGGFRAISRELRDLVIQHYSQPQTEEEETSEED